jgi:hypothetical protein
MAPKRRYTPLNKQAWNDLHDHLAEAMPLVGESVNAAERGHLRTSRAFLKRVRIMIVEADTILKMEIASRGRGGEGK